MKLKMLKLLLLFLSAGLFVSSKETADKCETKCIMQYLEQKKCSAGLNEKQTEVVDYQFALAPGSYIFFY